MKCFARTERCLLVFVALVAAALTPSSPAFAQPWGHFSEDVSIGSGVDRATPAPVPAPAPAPAPVPAPPVGGGVGGVIPVPPSGGGPGAGVGIAQPQNQLAACPPEGIVVNLMQEQRVYQFDDQRIDRPMSTYLILPISIDTTQVPAGWYHVFNKSGVDSGAWQRNESFYLRINSSARPDGFPRHANCDADWVTLDQDNGRPFPPSSIFYSGTFFIDSGTNSLKVAHYCPRFRLNECRNLHDSRDPISACDAPYPGRHSQSDNSVSFFGDAVCLIPTGVSTP